METSYQKQWQFLKRTVELGKIPHAYLFYGQNGSGIKDLALELVKLINGEDSLKGVHPDLVIIEPQDNGEIEISQIRELRSKLSLKSYSAPFKAAIIDQAHTLNEEAQSAFLKLLEEPKGLTLFILITSYPEMLLSTVLSRLERLRFCSSPQKYSGDDIKKISEIRQGDLAERFQYAKELSEDPQNLKKILETWLEYFREELLSDLRQTKTIKILKLLQTTHHLLSTTNVNRRLALEILMLEL